MHNLNEGRAESALRQIRLATALWALLVAVVALDGLGIALSGIGFDAASALDYNVVIGLVLCPFALFYTYVRFDEKIAALCASVAFLLIMSEALCLFTYVLTAFGGTLPLQDARLAAADHAIGFDWQSYLAFFDRHPWFSEIGRLAYMSIFEQSALAIVVLTFARQVERLQMLLLAFVLSCLICGTVAALAPALGTYHFYGVTAAHHGHIALTVKARDVPVVLALRDGTFGTFSLARASGIVTFPSFHSCLGALFVWAFWRVATLRWIALALNGAMIVATPVQGSHYLTDVAAGLLVAVVTIQVVETLARAFRNPVFPGAFGTVAGEAPVGA
jgi:hypothetical protein